MADRDIISEKQYDRQIKHYVKRQGGLYLKLNATFESGIPDRQILLKGGHSIFVELKSKGKSLTPLQDYWRYRLSSMGHQHYVVDSQEALEHLISELKLLTC